jgi:GNAT superfamily N-acetyltransferase
MCARWPVGPMRRAMSRGDARSVHAEVVKGITIRQLRKGEAEVVQAVFDRLGERSRLLRFGGAKTTLSAADLEQLTRVDEDHHVLVALVGNVPIGIARLVRDGADAAVAFAVVDEWQHRGVGTVLAERLAADARAAGIERLHATMHADNRDSLALMRRVTHGLTMRTAAGQLEVSGRAA